jgi:hypothetical protein
MRGDGDVGSTDAAYINNAVTPLKLSGKAIRLSSCRVTDNFQATN